MTIRIPRRLLKQVRKLNLRPRRAILADRAGVLYEPGRPGYVRVRYPASPDNTDALAYPTTVRLNAVVPMKPGQPVWVGYDADNEVAVVFGDFSGALAAGGSPLVNNPSDDNIFRFLDQRDITTLRCQRVGPGAPLSVSVLGWAYIKDGTYHGFIGQQLDLTASIPGTANTYRLALVALKTDDTLEVVTSTAQNVDEPLDETDIQECVTALTSGSLPVHLWKLVNAMTELTDTHDYMDFRQFLNISTSSAGGGSMTQTEIDFGSTPTRSKAFTVTDAAVSATSKLMAVQAGDAPTGKSADENEMDALIFRCLPASGSFTLYADCLTGAVVGNFKVNYQIAA